MADDDTNDDLNTDDAPATVDFSEFVPEQFKTDDGWNTAGFREEFDSLAAFRAQTNEKLEALPEEASGFEWAMPEDHQWPEGFDPATMNTKDEQGNDVEFDPAAMFDKDDPDVGQAQSIWHKVAKGEIDPQAGFKQLAGVMVNREIRGLQESAKTYTEEIGKLGSEAKSRIDNLSRTVRSTLPATEAEALLNGLTTADALRGMEKLIQKAGTTTPSAPTGKDYASMTIDERIMAGLKERK
ncbi:MAG: hypothetical protein JXQ91_07695 [Vannielia sp.]|uniref:hypothetical protein n=1 Tax=Vannielia sp. TaxID=2813045 RepID=UPI003B8E0D28